MLPVKGSYGGARSQVRAFQHTHLNVPTLSAVALPARDTAWGYKWGCPFFSPQVCSPGQKTLPPLCRRTKLLEVEAQPASLKWKKGERDSRSL